MYLENKTYIVSTYVRINYIPTLSEYNIILNPDKRTNKEFSNTLIMEITNSRNTTKKIALVGDYLSFDKNCIVLDCSILTILQNKYITQLNLEDNQILVHKKIKVFCGFEIHKCSDGYIIYGETEIVKLDSNLKELWRFSGTDIFVTANNQKPFELCGNKIKLRDWNSIYYELDLNGNLIFSK